VPRRAWARGLLTATALAALGADAPERPNGFDLSGASVARDAILRGGPPRDGIPRVDAPTFASPETATWVAPTNTVLGIEIAGDARAYPVHLLEYHQLVNDVVGGVPVAATYDPIGAVPRVFRREVDGRVLRFGISGLIYSANFLIYDLETESLWSQFLGRAIAGPLAGRTLARVTVRQEPLAAWLARHPHARVLERPLPGRIDYRYSPYEAHWVSQTVPFSGPRARRPLPPEGDRRRRRRGRPRARLSRLEAHRGGRARRRRGRGPAHRDRLRRRARRLPLGGARRRRGDRGLLVRLEGLSPGDRGLGAARRAGRGRRAGQAGRHSAALTLSGPAPERTWRSSTSSTRAFTGAASPASAASRRMRAW
jgi:hypothetical protein